MNDAETMRYDCSLAAAAVILDVLDESPGGGKAEPLAKITLVVLETIHESEQMLREIRSQAPSMN